MYNMSIIYIYIYIYINVLRFISNFNKFAIVKLICLSLTKNYHAWEIKQNLLAAAYMFYITYKDSSLGSRFLFFP